jgi:hypothetical protein
MRNAIDPKRQAALEADCPLYFKAMGHGSRKAAPQLGQSVVVNTRLPFISPDLRRVFSRVA